MMGNMSRFHIRPARPDETGLFYTPHPEEDRRRGTIGHVRMDFGRSGNEFWHTWWPRGPEELNSPVFKAELQEVVDTMRENVLKSRFSMERFCYEHGGKIAGGYVQNYGYIVETEHYRYCLRCNPSPGDYNGYLTAYDLDVQRQNMARGKALVGRVTYANGDAQDFSLMRHAFDFSNLVNRHSIHEIHPHPAELSVRQVLPDLRNLLGATADFRHPVMRLLHADIRSGNRCCFLGKLVQCKGMISVDMILFLGSMIVCIRQGLPFQKFFLAGKVLAGQADDGFVGIHVNDSVGVFLVQRIAALSVKHNMSSVSVLGGW